MIRLFAFALLVSLLPGVAVAAGAPLVSDGDASDGDTLGGGGKDSSD